MPLDYQCLTGGLYLQTTLGCTLNCQTPFALDPIVLRPDLIYTVCRVHDIKSKAEV